jgi:1,4-dihydroxy-2-naphthoate octaprenyltransferase
MAPLRIGFAATRPPFLAASLLPVLVGTAWGARGLLPAWALLVPATLFAAAAGAARALAGSRTGLRRGITTTLAIHGAGATWLGAVALL